jgi:hypothetical protein
MSDNRIHKIGKRALRKSADALVAAAVGRIAGG